jgi:hypothetical protein
MMMRSNEHAYARLSITAGMHKYHCYSENYGRINSMRNSRFLQGDMGVYRSDVSSLSNILLNIAATTIGVLVNNASIVI